MQALNDMERYEKVVNYYFFKIKIFIFEINFIYQKFKYCCHFFIPFFFFEFWINLSKFFLIVILTNNHFKFRYFKFIFDLCKYKQVQIEIIQPMILFENWIWRFFFHITFFSILISLVSFFTSFIFLSLSQINSYLI